MDAAWFVLADEQVEDQCADDNRESADFFGVPTPEPAPRTLGPKAAQDDSRGTYERDDTQQKPANARRIGRGSASGQI